MNSSTPNRLPELVLDSEELVLRELESKSLYDDLVRIEAELDVVEQLLSRRNIGVRTFVNVACGPAVHHAHAFLVRHPEARVISTDISPTFIALAEDDAAMWAPAVAERASFRVGDMRRLAIADGSADFVALFGNSFGFFDHAGNEAVLLEMRRVLRRPGIALVTVPSFEYVSAFTAGAPLRWIERAETRDGLIEVHGERYYTGQGQCATGRYRVFNRTTGEWWVKDDIASAVYAFRDDSGRSTDFVTLASRCGFDGAELLPLTADHTRNALGLMHRMDCIALHC